MSPTDALQGLDLYRIFIGDFPWWFGLEVAGRTLFMYLYTLLIIRTTGSRAMGQLSLIEFLLVIGIGSAVGDPMVYHDVPLLHGMIVVTVVVWINRWVVTLINTSERFEHFIEGGPKQLVSDGRMHPDVLKATNLNREKLFEMLRLHGIHHLGEVKYAILEQSGGLSLSKTSGRVPGLRIMPPWDIDPPTCWEAGDAPEQTLRVGCQKCGHVIGHNQDPLPVCQQCEGTSWVSAVGQEG